MAVNSTDFYSSVIGLGQLETQTILNFYRSFTMNIRTTLAATMTALVLLTAAGCAVTRGQETVGAYVDDTTITTQIKARFLDNKQVDGTSISVETLNGTVMLSGFAKSGTEKSTAESIARGVNGVKSVRNEIAVRP
jgi:osmotically-inducible protein OsmY